MVVTLRWKWEEGGGWRQKASLRGGGFRGTASPAHHPRIGAPGRGGKGCSHSPKMGPRTSGARAANITAQPALEPGPPSVRNGSGESYPDPSGTETREERENDKTSEPRRTSIQMQK